MLKPPNRFATFVAAMVPSPATDEELERMRTAAEVARTAQSQAADRTKRLEAEITAAKTAAQPRPELAEAMAELTAKEIEARVKALPLAKGHTERVAEARAAIAEAEARRTEAELVLPALEAMRPEITADVRRTRDTFNKASGTYGTALALRVAADRYLPAVASALAAEAELAEIEDAWGGNVSFELGFLNPSGGDRWNRRDVEKRASSLSEEQAQHPTQAAPQPEEQGQVRQ
jgi:hypothetical protein